jgi:hypothetical protein
MLFSDRIYSSEPDTTHTDLSSVKVSSMDNLPRTLGSADGYEHCYFYFHVLLRLGVSKCSVYCWYKVP